jgi:hypothetical protein
MLSRKGQGGAQGPCRPSAYRRFDVVLAKFLVSKERMKPLMALFLHVHAFAILACTSQQPGVIEVPPEGTPSIPGPMPGFGPFPTYSDALLAACPKILSLDEAVASRPETPRLRFFQSTPKEYCAWIYYTPGGSYEMSLAAVNPRRHESRCRLPDYVHDARYTGKTLGYVFAVHNHPLRSELSFDDIGFIVEQAMLHGLTVTTPEKEVDLGIAAFFSKNKATQQPTCDGLHLYFPRTGELFTWNRDSQGDWVKKPYGKVSLREKSGGPGFDIKIEKFEE